MSATRIVIAEDHPMFRGALALTLARLAPHAERVEAASHDELVQRLHESGDARLVVLDLHIPGARGLSTLVWLRSEHPEVPVAIVSGSADPDIAERVRALGAIAYVPKAAPIETIEHALAQVLAGAGWYPPRAAAVADPHAQLREQLGALTTQQHRVLRLLTDGLLNKQIAAELGISEGTVRAHVTAILQKLGVATRTQAVLLVTEIDGP